MSIWFGGDYNPEQWDAVTWDCDDALMRRAQVNTVTALRITSELGKLSASPLPCSRREGAQRLVCPAPRALSAGEWRIASRP